VQQETVAGEGLGKRIRALRGAERCYEPGHSGKWRRVLVTRGKRGRSRRVHSAAPAAVGGGAPWRDNGSDVPDAVTPPSSVLLLDGPLPLAPAPPHAHTAHRRARLGGRDEGAPRQAGATRRNVGVPGRGVAAWRRLPHRVADAPSDRPRVRGRARTCAENCRSMT
jgi:hypothetical protein